MALTFEFVQVDEFDDPQYDVIDNEDGELIGYIYYNNGWWLFMLGRKWGVSSGYLLEIAYKLEKINAATKSQRILGVF